MGQHEISTLIEDAPGWNESLATTSEAHIKVCNNLSIRFDHVLRPSVVLTRLTPAPFANVSQADRSNMSTEDLQEKTIRHLLRRNDSDDWPKATGSMYVRDEVMGPLGCAHVGDAEGVSDPEGDGQPVVRIVREEQLKVKQDLKPTDSET